MKIGEKTYLLAIFITSGWGYYLGKTGDISGLLIFWIVFTLFRILIIKGREGSK